MMFKRCNGRLRHSWNKIKVQSSPWSSKGELWKCTRCPVIKAK